MDQILTCPSCTKRLKATPAMAGKPCKCPGCGMVIVCPPEPPPVDPLAGWDDFFEDEKAKQPVDIGPPIDLSTLGGAPSKRSPAAIKTSGQSLFSPLVSCRDCRSEVSRSAKFCPHCGCRNPAVQQWAYLLAAAVVFTPFILVGGCMFLAIVAPKDVRQAKPTWTADLSAAKQAERKQLIDELVRRGAFLKVVKPAKLPHVWITPAFRALDYDTKREFISIVFLYYQPVEMVVLKDSLNGKRVGSYSPTLGLSID